MYIIIYKGNALQSFCSGTCCNGAGGGSLGLGAGHPPCQFVSNVVNDSLYVVFYGCNFYGNVIIIYLIKTWDVYIIIGRHTSRDARAMHGQLVQYVLEQFICQCLLYIRVMWRHPMKFYITMIILVQLNKITQQFYSCHEFDCLQGKC